MGLCWRVFIKSRYWEHGSRWCPFQHCRPPRKATLSWGRAPCGKMDSGVSNQGEGRRIKGENSIKAEEKQRPFPPSPPEQEKFGKTPNPQPHPLKYKPECHHSICSKGDVSSPSAPLPFSPIVQRPLLGPDAHIQKHLPGDATSNSVACPVAAMQGVHIASLFLHPIHYPHPRGRIQRLLVSCCQLVLVARSQLYPAAIHPT